MRWWGWGEDGHAVPLPLRPRRCCATSWARTRACGSRRWPSIRSRFPIRTCPARRASGWPRPWARSNVRDDRATRIAHAVGRSLPRPRADSLRRRVERARRGGAARVGRAGGRGAGRLRRAQGRRRPVRRRHQRGGRRRAGPRRLRRGDLARPGAAVGDRRGGPRRRSRRGSTPGLFGPEAERRLRRAGRHARPLPAVVRVLDGGRLGGHALGGPGVDRLRAHRRAGRGAALRHAGRRARHEARAGLGGRSQRCASWWWAPRASWA